MYKYKLCQSNVGTKSLLTCKSPTQGIRSSNLIQCQTDALASVIAGVFWILFSWICPLKEKLAFWYSQDWVWWSFEASASSQPSGRTSDAPSIDWLVRYKRSALNLKKSIALVLHKSKSECRPIQKIGKAVQILPQYNHRNVALKYQKVSACFCMPQKSSWGCLLNCESSCLSRELGYYKLSLKRDQRAHCKEID